MPKPDLPTPDHTVEPDIEALPSAEAGGPRRPRKRVLLGWAVGLTVVLGVAVWAISRLGPEADVLPIPPEAAEPLLEPGVADDPSQTGFTPGLAAFAVEAGEWTIPYRVFGLFVGPGEMVPIRPVEATLPGAEWHAAAAGGTLAPAGEAAWTWTAPDSAGPYPIRITDLDSGEALTLHAFVGVPYDAASESIDGYRIGRYARSDDPINAPPPFFVRLTPDVADVAVSPHFTVGQFVAKQASDYPKYLALSERLLLKLEGLLQAANEAGISARTFTIMSAYRTPFYNASIGNTTTVSRHLFGDAADIFIDDDGDGQMDDLDGDGQITEADARLLAGLVEAQAGEAWYEPFVGGLGVYGPAPHRGPFIHVDTRGTPTRW
jgi:hypothetical protein